MKRMIIAALSLLMATGVMAQRGFHGGYGHYGGFYARPRVSIGIGGYIPLYPGYGFGSPYYGYGYPPMGYGYGYGYNNGYGNRSGYTPSKLSLQIQDIRNDYNHQIWQVRHDKSIRRRDRKRQVHELEHARDKAIIQAQQDYYEKPPLRRHNFNSNN